MNLTPGLAALKREERRLFWRKLEDAALMIGGIIAIITIIITK